MYINCESSGTSLPILGEFAWNANSPYIANVTMGNTTKTLRRFVLSMVFMFIFFFVVKSRKHTIPRKLMHKITKAFSLAFEVEETTGRAKDGIDEIRAYPTKKDEVKDSRFDVIGYEDIVFY